MAMTGQVEMKLERTTVPGTDVDRAKAFYVEPVGFNADHDHTVSDEIRFVQLTPPGSACSISIGRGLSGMAPGSLDGLPVVVAALARAVRGPAGWRRRHRRGARRSGRTRGGRLGRQRLPVGPLRLLRRPRRQP